MAHSLCIYFRCEFIESFYTFFNQSFSSEFNLNKTVLAIAQMYDCITFKTAFILVVIDIAVKGRRVCAKIANDKCLEHDAECRKIFHQLLRSKA